MAKSRKPITSKDTKVAQKMNQSMGDLLNPMNVPQPGDPMTKLYANDDSPA